MLSPEDSVFRNPLVAAALLATISSPAQASGLETAGSVIEWSLVGVAAGASIAQDDWKGVGQLALGLGTAQVVTYGLKQTIHSRRPDGSDNESFPSGHASTSFAAAGYIHKRHGWEYGVPALLAATFVGYTRVEERRHRWYDVVAGAAIGTGSAWVFTSRYNDNVRLTPWGDSKGAGMTIAARF